MVLWLFIAAAVTQQPGRDPALLHRHVDQIVAEKEQEQEATLRRILTLGGSPEEQAEVTARLASLLRARGLLLSIKSQAESDQGDEIAAGRDRARAADARAEAIGRYRELLKKYPDAPRLDEALFFLADILQDSGRDQEAIASARELVKRYPRSAWGPASHVFIGEHYFEKAKLDDALREYRAAAETLTDEVYPYALYKAAWCRFNQSGFVDAMKLLRRVVEVSSKAGDANKVQLAREARRDYVIAYARIGKPETARDEFTRIFGDSGRKMLEQYGKLLFDTGRDPEAQLVHRQLLEIHGDTTPAALDRTRLLAIAQRSGRRKDLLQEAKALTETFLRVKKNATQGDEAFEEASRLAEETLRTLAIQIHNEARKTDLEETWAAARSLYSQYLIIFPDAADAYEMRFFYGELLFALDEKAEAAETYEAVVKIDVARKPPGRWLQKAAWSAVLSRDAVIRGDGKEKKDTGERRAQRPLTEDEQKLGSACLLYLQALPEGPHAVEVAFKVGRLEYISNHLEDAEKHLAWIALKHPEHELAEYAANLVLDISNLRKDWEGVHRWALKFLEDRKLAAHGSMLTDLKRIEEQSAYGIADSATPDAKKAEALLAFATAHPHGDLTDKALFGAAAALSRGGRIDDALAARARVWKEAAGSQLVPRALLAAASDHAAVGDLGEAAALFEKYAASYQKQNGLEKWLREHGKTQKPKPGAAVYEEAKAQTALHDAALLREARNELRQAIADRALAMKIWKKAADRDEDLFAQATLRAKLGEAARAAREFTALASEAKGKPALLLRALREAAKQYTRARETGNAQWSWTEIDRTWRSLGPKAREKLSPEALAAAAEAHFALGARGFDEFKKQQIKPPLMVTLNRKISLLQSLRKRAEVTVNMRQAEPAVCALGQLGEAQILLGQAIAQSPFPPKLNADQRKLYREMLGEKAQPLYADARETLKSADEKARELGVTGTCPAKVAALLEKVNAKPAVRQQMQLAPIPLAPVPDFVDADGNVVALGETP